MRFVELIFAYICDIYGFDFEKSFQNQLNVCDDFIKIH